MNSKEGKWTTGNSRQPGRSSGSAEINSYLQQALAAFNNNNFVQAEQNLQQLLKQQPRHIDAHYMLGSVAGRLGQYDRAAAQFEQVLQMHPVHLPAMSSLALAYRAVGNLDLAREVYLRLLKINKTDSQSLNNLAVVCCEMGRVDESIDCCNRALELRPGYASAHYNQGNALRDKGCFTQAIESYRKAAELEPQNPAIHHNWAEVLWKSGEVDLAESYLRTALRLNPDLPRAHSNLLFLLAARARLPHDVMLAEQRAWDERHGDVDNASRLSDGAVSVASGRRIRVGYLSPDFRTHAVSSFFEPLLAAHDRSRFEIFCYATHSPILSDAVTARLQGMSDHWAQVHHRADADIARQIHSDGVDILVDLSGHTSDNRLGVFTFKPSPVQVTYLGGFAATGLRTMDYWLTDWVLHPPDTQELATEKIMRLPRSWVSYQPPEIAPEVAGCPNENGRIVFGSFSNLSKLVPEVLQVWSRILDDLPGSRLLVMDRPLRDAGVREMVLSRLEESGIDRERLILQAGLPYQEYLGVYSQVDIVLDPFPRTGGTTSAEAIWMGVPLITLEGDRYVGRISSSQLVATGLQEFIARSIEEYVEKAVELARNPQRRAFLRRTMREQMRASEFCNGSSLARAVEQAYLCMCGID
jgi:predicted O-linked N-acetylglucosamine transferase (SPINDLY family)